MNCEDLSGESTSYLECLLHALQPLELDPVINPAFEMSLEPIANSFNEDIGH